MEIRELIEPDRVLDRLEVRDKTQLLAEIARRAAEAARLDPKAVLSALNAREQLGSTGVGHGVAVPHARIAGLPRLLGLFARLAHAIDFAAIDDQPVDIVFLMLIPAEAGNEYLAALSAVSRRLRDREVVRRMRAADGAAVLYDLLTAPSRPAPKAAS
jgi:PTS system nitrogen regulatory IIA component